MSVFALGLNHTTAPLDLRGRFAFSPDQVPPALRAFRERLARAVPEAALLSTCNRTELYVAADPAQVQQLISPAIDWLATHGQVGGDQLRHHTYVLEHQEAARHAFRVAAGLDSMVLGEPQILGQMKQARARGRCRRHAGHHAAPAVPAQLLGGQGSAQRPPRLARIPSAWPPPRCGSRPKLFEDLRDIQVLFVGAGEMIELVATHFAARSPTRHGDCQPHAGARREAGRPLRRQALRLADLPQRLHEFDAVVSCTASTLPIIGLGAVERALKARRHRPMFMVDLAVPRDIEPEVRALSDVYLYTVDDLSALVQTGGRKAPGRRGPGRGHHRRRRAELHAHWLDQRATVPLIQALHAQADDWRSGRTGRARARCWPRVPTSTRCWSSCRAA